MGKTSIAAVRRYNEKTYDRISVTVPKGERERIRAFAESQGQSVNGFICDLIRREMQGFQLENKNSAGE